jgi:hypothetical protein
LVAKKARARTHFPPTHLAEEAGEEGIWVMFTRLTDKSKAAIFSVLALCMAVGVALVINMLGLPPGVGMAALSEQYG